MFPPIEPLARGSLRADGLHQIYWETIGISHGTPVVFLHGGPGGGCSTLHRQFFDPALTYVTLFDQRGCNRSTPLGETRENTTQHLIEDIERLRKHLNIERWIVFGGSWGATLALAYGQAHPERCLGFVLRGVFLGSRAEIDWFTHGMGHFFPREEEAWLHALPASERDTPLASYLRRIMDEDPAIHLPAAQAWAQYEAACATLLQRSTSGQMSGQSSFCLARLEAHYMAHDCFLEPEQLLKNIHRIAHLPAKIVQGRYDIICPPRNAYRLAAAWPAARLSIIEAAGHSAHESGIESALVFAMKQLQSELAPSA
jgi:proline iminopeptidase